MSQHFTHLHLHTEYSLLDGAISIDRLVNFGKKHEMKALAITDHGNIFGAVKFFQKCKKTGIKPILGMEAYFTTDAKVKSADDKYNHLILLVQNQTGYRNLCKLISYSFQEGFYFKPRIDYKILEQHAEGLIVTSACLGGHIPQLLMSGNDAEAHTYIDWFLRVFGRDRFYLEVQPEDQHDQKILNQHLYRIAAERDIQLVATGDCHYVELDDHEAHEVMLSVQTHAKVTDENRFSFGDCRAYMRSPQDMLALFSEHPDAVWNSGKIADMCNFEFETGKLFFPQFQIPEEHTQDSYFRLLCQRGLDTLRENQLLDPALADQYQARLDLEMDLIIKMGFVGYFLVVSDFIQWARRNDIPVGPGRGSAAGSLAAWALEITNVDPLKYNLLFERFLNPERISMPDVDIDFCIEGRDRVINYVRDKYGHDKVCQIITFGTMMAKGVIKDVARALGISFEDSNMITNLIPDQLKITLHEAIEQEQRITELIDNNPRIKKLFDISFKLEGLTRHASKHAAGIVISPEIIDEVLPVYIPPKSTELVTQYAMTELESLGFLKIDFLGLKNLTLIDRALKLIKQIHDIVIDINRIPLDDAKTFALICQGKTSGVFQLESDGLKEVLRKLQPDKFEDIIAVNALYRPGPLGSGMVDDYIERRHGRQKIVYLFSELEPILQETYGVIVYQEQVIKIASTIGGYSLGEADILRRAMGKKKAEEMAAQRTIFLEKSAKKGFDGKKAGELFDLMAYFAGYGFNKSHSAAYAFIAYHTAYLKANYPAEFMACLISLEATHAEKMVFYLQEAKDMNLTVLPPDINRSLIDFTVVDGEILYGLQGIKNVGQAALENILAQRAQKPFIDMLDLCTRIDLRTSNKRVLEHLICAGACDELPGNRAQKYNELSKIIDRAVEKKIALETGQMDLFGTTNSTNAPDDLELYTFQPRAEWTNEEKLTKEQEAIGCYLSDHPLESYMKKYPWLHRINFSQALATLSTAQQESDVQVVCCGILKTHREITTKKGDRMSFVTLEDMSGVAEIVLFPSVFNKVSHWLTSHSMFVVKGTVDLTSPQKCKIKANEFIPLELLFNTQHNCERVTFHLPAQPNNSLLEKLKQQLTSGSLCAELIFNEQGKKVCVTPHTKIAVTQQLLTACTDELGITVNVRL